MSPARVLFSSTSHEWATPYSLYQALHQEFCFTLDPCPPSHHVDGLGLAWFGHRVYCNPPYGRTIAKWLAKASDAALAVYLLPARTDTIWFHDLILPKAREVRFLRGRLRFNEGGRATFPSMVVVYR